ncbi:FliM/FliN family flagellar motor switch protein [Hoeflea sp. TYP-13]|uniref:FliM/FliN family flagellar motor switch protein n=1 Tax=Hoeflea sp. TYP-13 TaxID=3230023 RepID=UPI0034C647C3
MTDPSSETSSRMDPTLVQRMIGRSGDRGTLETQCVTLAEVTALSLTLNAGKAIGFPITVAFEKFDIGERSELIAALDDNAVICSAGIGGWCDDIILSGSDVFVIAVMECMLGGTLPEDAAIESRALSDIELDVATVIFKQFAESMRAGIAYPPTEDVVADPATMEPPEAEEEEEDTPAVVIEFLLNLGSVEAPFKVILPQRPLLKTRITESAEEKPPAPEQPAWARQLTTQITRSHVMLEARIALSELTLGEVARLQVGDLLPFADEGAVRALLSAGGKELFWCEFGKAGNRYTVRVQEPHRHEHELIRELASG